MEKKLYCRGDGSICEIFDSEETARMAYVIWCHENHEPYDEATFKEYYLPLEESDMIWTMEDIHEYDPS